MKIRKLQSMSWIMVLAMMAITAFIACSDSDGEEDTTVVFPELKTLNCGGNETAEISFETNADWELSSNAGWCKFQNGEFLESLIYGKAGKQTVTIKASNDGQNYNEDAIAEITLKMSGQSQVIYKVTRAKKEYENLVVSDEDGNIYDKDHPLTIKGNNAFGAVYTVLSARVESGVKIGFTNPEWLDFTIDEATGAYKFTFNIENTIGLNAKYAIAGGKYVLTFVTEDANTAKTDKVRKVEIPLIYEGLQRDVINISPTYQNAVVSVDGKDISDGVTTVNRMESVITVYNDEFEVMMFEQQERDGVYTYNFGKEVNWLHASIGANADKDKLTVTVDRNLNTEQRSASIMVFPKTVYDEIKGDWEGNLIDAGTSDIKANYTANIMATLTQEAWREQGERIGFKALFLYAYDYDQTGFRNIKDFHEGAFVKFEDLKNSANVEQYNVTDNNVWKAIIPRSFINELGELGPGKLIFELVDAATDQEIQEKQADINIASEKMAGKAWSQDAKAEVRIDGLGIAFNAPDSYKNDYQLVVMGEGDEVIALCIVEIVDDEEE